jgi:hypothetical protein
MCEEFEEPSLSRLDNNVYVKLNDHDSPVIWYGQKLKEDCTSQFSTSEEINRIQKEFEPDGLSLINYKGPLFENLTLRNFELLEELKGAVPAKSMPENVKNALNTYDSRPYIGAYPGH